jgi:hypothetical protein
MTDFPQLPSVDHPLGSLSLSHLGRGHFVAAVHVALQFV